VEPLAPHEKILIDDEFIEEDENHGDIACDECHGGNPDDPNWKTAHDGVVKDPTYPEPEVCMACHEDEASNYQNSLHISNSPMAAVVLSRTNTTPEIKKQVATAQQAHCTQCHSSCGQCHISRPTSVGCGFLSGHLFQKKPPMQEVCIACHGSRVGNEFLGKEKQCKPDIHFEKQRMTCEKCHPASEMHGDNKDYKHRYNVENGPECNDCHKQIYTEKGENVNTHQSHQNNVSCQVCHAQPYTSCYGCHVGETPEGQKFYEVKSHSVGFKIGLNTKRTPKHPEKFVTVRHSPVDRDTFKFYADNGLSNFDSFPTWKMATPHNIRRKTTQNSSCNNCHGNPLLFLMEENVQQCDLEANRPVIVTPDQIPEKITP